MKGLILGGIGIAAILYIALYSRTLKKKVSIKDFDIDYNGYLGSTEFEDLFKIPNIKGELKDIFD